MKRKVLSTLLAVTMVAGMVTGCGNKEAAGTTTATEAGTTTEKEADNTTAADNTVTEAAEEGKVLNVYCWNDEFQRRVKAHYPGYTEVDATHGTIGDVQVVWNITPNADNAYQNNLDEALLNQANASTDEKVDLFLIEADYALKYVDSDATMPIADLGITDADTANQYQYTKDIVTDSNGVLKGLSWQGCPGVMFYSREIAKEVFGTDEPAEVQKKVADWDTYKATADELKAAGYQINSSANDAYRVYSNNVTSKWVVDGKINIDENIMKWVEISKELVDAGEVGTHDIWSDDWSKGFYPEGKVFSYFGPAWLINFCMAADQEGSIGNQGGWAATEGPQ